MTGHRGGWESICGEMVMPLLWSADDDGLQSAAFNCGLYSLHLSLYLYRQSTVRDSHLKCNYGHEGRVDGVTRDQ